MQQRKISFSAIILTKNSVLTIEKCLQSVFEQTYKAEEVIVVDGNSSDGTAEVIKKYPAIVVTEPGLGYGHARNVGLNKSNFDIVAFVDSDCVLEKTYFQELIYALNAAEKNVAGVGGVTFSLEDDLISESFNVRLFGYSPSNEKKIREINSIGGGVSVYHKELILKIGGFDTFIRGGEDFDLNLRLRNTGYKILVIPSAKSFHFHPNSMKSFTEKWFSYGRFLVDVSIKNHLKKEIIFSWGWVFTCFLILFSAFLIDQFLLWILLLLDFILPWILFYGRETFRFLINKPKLKYLALPFIHQVGIISRSAGVITETFRYFLGKTRLSMD